MYISGIWRLCDDGVLRPTFWAEIRDATGDWLEVPFLADCGADRTVLSMDVFEALRFPKTESEHAIAGLGGVIDSFEFSSVLRMYRSDGVGIYFRGQFAASVSTALDMCLLGRDITNNFALVVDRPRDKVCLLYRGEVYQA